jgi:hypothetical protein
MTENLKLQTWYFVAGIILAVVALITLGREFGKTSSETTIKNLEEKLAFYATIKELNLSNKLDSLVIANKSIETNLKNINDYYNAINQRDSLRNSLTYQNNKLDSLYNENNKSNSTINELNKVISSYKQELKIINLKRNIFKIAQNGSDDLIKNICTIGLTDITNYNVDINISIKKDNYQHSLKVGEKLPIDFENIHGMLTLKEISDYVTSPRTCTFDFVIID